MRCIFCKCKVYNREKHLKTRRHEQSFKKGIFPYGIPIYIDRDFFDAIAIDPEIRAIDVMPRIKNTSANWRVKKKEQTTS